MGSKQSQIESQDKEMLQKLMSLKQLILYLDENNINESVDSSLFYFDEKFPYSFNFIICSILYSCFIIEFNKSGMEYLKQIEIRERDIYNNENYKVIDIFIQFLFNIHSQESNFLLNKIIENDLTDSNICKNKVTPYFAHYMSNEELSRFKSNHLYKFFFDNHEELSKNDWELHKKFIEEGHNPNEIALIIRNDEIEKLQEISSKNDFDFNQIIDPSLYERCSFINEENVTLIDYAAFFGSIKCFRYLLMNSANVYYAGKYAVAVGNEEIIHLCEQNHSSFEGAYKAAIIFHRNDIFKYLYENKIKEINNLEKLGKKCIIHHNYEVLAFLFENGMKVNDSLIIVSIETGNIFILKYLLGKNPISINFMEIRTFSGNKELFNFIIRNKYVSNKNKKDLQRAFLNATQNGNYDIIKFLIEQEGIDINAQNKWPGWTALMCASKNGHVEIAELLLEQEGININAKDHVNGETALILATRNGKIDIVKLLLKHNGIDINVKGEIGETALMKAFRYCENEIAKLLLEQDGIDINDKNDDGQTVLILCVLHQGNPVEIVKLILKHEGIDVNIKDESSGNTALMYASKYGKIDLVKLILEQEGVDINSKNNGRKTALDMASSKGFTEIVNLLIERSNNS